MLANPRMRQALGGLVVLVVGYMFVLPMFQSSDAAAPLEIPEHPNPGPTYTLKPQVYNLLVPASQQPRYLKLGVVFEFEEEDPAFYHLEGHALEIELEHFEEELAPKAPIIADAVGSIVGARSWTDINTALGRDQLKTELKDRVTEIVGEPHLVNVYFTEFVSQ